MHFCASVFPKNEIREIRLRLHVLTRQKNCKIFSLFLLQTRKASVMISEGDGKNALQRI